MYIVISHITRMEFGRICVAGIEPVSLSHIRPILSQPLKRELLRKEGGVFEIGAVVELGLVRDVGRKPEIEDRGFSLNALRYRERLKPDAFWRLLKQTSYRGLRAIFGNELERRGKTCATSVGQGVGSLGNLQPKGKPELRINNSGKIRIGIYDGTFRPEVSVTDIRLYEKDQQTARHAVQEAIASRCKNTNVILSVGLSRPWKKEGDSAERHWLQVNNIHFEDDPLGESFNF